MFRPRTHLCPGWSQRNGRALSTLSTTFECEANAMGESEANVYAERAEIDPAQTETSKCPYFGPLSANRTLALES